VKGEEDEVVVREYGGWLLIGGDGCKDEGGFGVHVCCVCGCAGLT